MSKSDEHKTLEQTSPALKLAFQILRTAQEKDTHFSKATRSLSDAAIAQLQSKNSRISIDRMMESCQKLFPEFFSDTMPLTPDNLIQMAKKIVKNNPFILLTKRGKDITPEHRRAFLIWKYNTGKRTDEIGEATDVKVGVVTAVGRKDGISTDKFREILAPFGIPTETALVQIVNEKIASGTFHVPTNAEYEKVFPRSTLRNVERMREQYLDGYEEMRRKTEKELLDLLDGNTPRRSSMPASYT